MLDINSDKDLSLAVDLLRLYDEFSEYESCCAFFCDAVACLGSRKDNWLDSTSAEGLCFFSHWMKQRSKVLKGRLDTIRKNIRLQESV